MLHAVMVYPCDALIKKFPGVKLSKYVDDISLAMQGKQKVIEHEIVEAWDWLQDFLEEELDCEVSLDNAQREGKTVAICSSKRLAGRLAGKLRSRGITIVTRAKNLGIEQRGAGKKSKGTFASKRAAKNRKRLGKISFAKSKGGLVRKVIQQGLQPSLLYGAKVRGLAPRFAEELRKITSQGLPGNHAGRSKTLRLSMYKADPLHRINATTVVEWASVVWDGDVSEATLQAAWKRQAVKMNKKPAWGKVEGPAGAVRMQMRDLGWKWPSWSTMISEEGLVMDLREICPDDLKQMALRDSERNMWKRWCAKDGNQHLAPEPFMEPIQQWLKKGGQHSPGQAVVAQAVACGMWTQERGYKLGVLEDPWCKHCEKNRGKGAWNSPAPLLGVPGFQGNPGERQQGVAAGQPHIFGQKPLGQRLGSKPRREIQV